MLAPRTSPHPQKTPQDLLRGLERGSSYAASKSLLHYVTLPEILPWCSTEFFIVIFLLFERNGHSKKDNAALKCLK